MSDLFRLSAAEIARRIASGAVSSREVAEDALARIDAVNPKLNAIVETRPEETLARADAIDAMRAKGAALGPLAGVPITIKVNTDQAGFATTNGLTLQKELVAKSNSPVVDNLEKAGAVIIGRTNTPAFSYRWFTSNRLHGATKNPRDPSLTPGGSSGGAASAVASGMGAIAHGTDIGGSVRYPAYACGVHGIRPGMSRVPAYNASSPERGIGAQLMAVSGPLARTVEDLSIALRAMSVGDARDPWWVPAPFDGPDVKPKAALCIRPDGMKTVPEVEAALKDAGQRLKNAGWQVEEIDATPPLREAAQLQLKLWLCDGFDRSLEMAEKEGDPGALMVLGHYKDMAGSLQPNFISEALTRRAALVRLWNAFFERYPVCLMPVCAELPFKDGEDMAGGAVFDRIWDAQVTQTGLPFIGVPGLTVTTGLVGKTPVGVQVVANRFREDLCFKAGLAIEAGGVPASPIDPSV